MPIQSSPCRSSSSEQIRGEPSRSPKGFGDSFSEEFQAIGIAILRRQHGWRSPILQRLVKGFPRGFRDGFEAFDMTYLGCQNGRSDTIAGRLAQRIRHNAGNDA